MSVRKRNNNYQLPASSPPPKQKPEGMQLLKRSKEELNGRGLRHSSLSHIQTLFELTSAISARRVWYLCRCIHIPGTAAHFENRRHPKRLSFNNKQRRALRTAGTSGEKEGGRTCPFWPLFLSPRVLPPSPLTQGFLIQRRLNVFTASQCQSKMAGASATERGSKKRRRTERASN